MRVRNPVRGGLTGVRGASKGTTVSWRNAPDAATVRTRRGHAPPYRIGGPDMATHAPVSARPPEPTHTPVSARPPAPTHTPVSARPTAARSCPAEPGDAAVRP